MGQLVAILEPADGSVVDADPDTEGDLAQVARSTESS
jgi:hypothetical protein